MKKKERLFDRTSLLLLISVVMINVICIITVSYAYFTTQIKGNDASQPITVVMGNMKIKYEDSDLVTLDNAMPGDYLTNKFRITNEGNLDATYNLKIDIIENNFRDKGDLEYTLKRNGEPIVENETLPYTDGYILVNQTIATDGVDNYELEVKFKEDLVDKNQNDNKNRKLDFKIVVDSNENAEKYVYVPLYKDNSGANIPELYQGLIPIYYNESNQIVIADVTQEWYNYDDHEWANAVLIDHTNKDIVNKFYNEDGTLKDGDIVTTDDILQMYVWIPRYKYQLFNAVAGQTSESQMINIKFENGEDTTGNVSCKYINHGNGTIEEKCTNADNGEWYTHPAFTFGDTELGGIWVGKFEPSDPTDETGKQKSTIEEITILPNKSSVVLKSISTMFNAEQKLQNIGNKYNLKTSEIDTHPMKNIEWGAVAYLTSSKYGRYNDAETCITGGCEVWVNNTANRTTGCVGDSVSATGVSECNVTNQWNTSKGVNASTTGNIYGIYDMSGGSWEYLMGVILQEGKADIHLGNSGFTTEGANKLPDIKYYDIYTYDTSYFTIERGHLGDATREVLQISSNNYFCWNTDFAAFPDIEPDRIVPWFERGGENRSSTKAGIFGYVRWTGGAYENESFRSVLSAA